jgi:hypothetical protein
MKDKAMELRGVVDQASPRLARISGDEAARKESPEKWSKKEILGHLIDSASTNHQRFVRACYGAAVDFPGYKQNEWVRFQCYAEEPWSDVVALWSTYNRHLSHVIARLPASAKDAPVNFRDNKPSALEFVVGDYLRHLRHHLEQILAGEG